MKERWKWHISLILLAEFIIILWAFWPTYEIKTYKLGFYPYTYITQMIYQSIGKRQLIYIYGKHLEETYPQKDFVVQHDFAGFDSYSVIIADLDSNQHIVLNVYESGFKTPVPSSKINVHLTDSEEWETLSKNQIGLRITAE